MEELAALAVLNEMPQWRGNRLAKLYQKAGSFSVILRAYNRSVDPGKIIVQYEQRGVQLVPFWDRNYPKLLSQIEGGPLLLYVRGSPKILQGEMASVVGSRNYKKENERRVEDVVAKLVDDKQTIVSGLARGIDTLSHRAALKFGGGTIAVLAHGLDKVYPKENEALAEEIVNSGGALISELPWGAEITRKYFLARNRIIVGMAAKLIVIEAGLQSGSLASASLAAEMGRDVYALPGSPGTDLLLEEGAERWK